MQNLIHLTIQTGHTSAVPPPISDVCAALRPLLADGGGDIGDITPSCRGLTLTTCKRPWSGCLSWDISRAGAPIALCVFCRDAAAQASAWATIERTYMGLSDRQPAIYAPGSAPSMPDRLPWLVTLLLPGMLLHLDVLEYLADLDQCIAYAAEGMVTNVPS